MAVYALTSQTLSLNGDDLSSLCRSVTLTVDAAQLDTTDFASAGWTEMIGGLKSGTLAIELHDDMADDGLDEDLWGILGTVVTFAVKPTSAAKGPSNPEYSGSVLITQWTTGGTVGELATKSLSFPISGAVTRSVS